MPQPKRNQKNTKKTEQSTGNVGMHGVCFYIAHSAPDQSDVQVPTAIQTRPRATGAYFILSPILCIFLRYCVKANSLLNNQFFMEAEKHLVSGRYS
jgi:hypothetical protein